MNADIFTYAYIDERGPVVGNPVKAYNRAINKNGSGRITEVHDDGSYTIMVEIDGEEYMQRCLPVSLPAGDGL